MRGRIELPISCWREGRSGSGLSVVADVKGLMWVQNATMNSMGLVVSRRILCVWLL